MTKRRHRELSNLSVMDQSCVPQALHSLPDPQALATGTFNFTVLKEIKVLGSPFLPPPPYSRGCPKSHTNWHQRPCLPQNLSRRAGNTPQELGRYCPIEGQPIAGPVASSENTLWLTTSLSGLLQSYTARRHTPCLFFPPPCV